jgi:hypothetical protein
MLRRLQAGLGALLGSPEARRAQEFLARLDRVRDWLREYRAAPGHYAAQLDALIRVSRPDEASAVASLRERAAATERALETALQEAMAAIDRADWAAGELYVETAERHQQTLEEIRQELAQRVRRHIERQRAVWRSLQDSGAFRRASILLDELREVPELPGLPKPDVSRFAAARDRLWALMPEECRSEDVSTVCFDVDAVEEAAREAIEAAPQAEAAITAYFYEAARAHLAALGPERAARVAQLLRDPEALRGLREQHPELIEAQPVLSGFLFGGPDLFTLLLLYHLFSAHSPGWHVTPPLPPGEQPDFELVHAPADAVTRWLHSLPVALPAADEWPALFEQADLLAGSPFDGLVDEEEMELAELDELEVEADELDAGDAGDWI